ncbi:hypothetical protein GQ42DRAFT_161385 [Ramicandelaber brevisporus]|nr:hypothetical protein GQ42DRAFT_161385 [Ramicandelaber brevisporus]
MSTTSTVPTTAAAAEADQQATSEAAVSSGDSASSVNSGSVPPSQTTSDESGLSESALPSVEMSVSQLSGFSSISSTSSTLEQLRQSAMATTAELMTTTTTTVPPQSADIGLDDQVPSPLIQSQYTTTASTSRNVSDSMNASTSGLTIRMPRYRNLDAPTITTMTTATAATFGTVDLHQSTMLSPMMMSTSQLKLKSSPQPQQPRPVTLPIPMPRQPIANQPEPYVPLTRSRGPLDAALQSLLALVFRDLVREHISKITPNRDFDHEVMRVIGHVTRELERRCKAINWPSLLLIEVPNIVQLHIRDYWLCHRKLSTVYGGGHNIEQLFHAAQPHVALLEIDGDGAKDVEQTYLRRVADDLLMVLLPRNEVTADAVRHLIRELLTSALKNALDTLSDPSLLNSLIVKYGTHYLDTAPPAEDGQGAGEGGGTTPNIGPQRTETLEDMLMAAQTSAMDRSATLTGRQHRTRKTDKSNSQQHGSASTAGTSKHRSRRSSRLNNTAATTATAAVATAASLASTNDAQTASFGQTLSTSMRSFVGELGVTTQWILADIGRLMRAASRLTSNGAQPAPAPSEQAPPTQQPILTRIHSFLLHCAMYLHLAASHFLYLLWSFLSSLAGKAKDSVMQTKFMSTATATIAQVSSVRPSISGPSYLHRPAASSSSGWIPPILIQPPAVNLLHHALGLIDEVLQLSYYNRWLMVQLNYYILSLVTLLAGTAIDRLAGDAVLYSLSEKQLAAYVNIIKEQFFPDGAKFRTGGPPRSFAQKQSDRMMAEQIIAAMLPSIYTRLFLSISGSSSADDKQQKREAAAKRILAPFQSRAINRHFVMVTLDLAISRIAPELVSTEYE